MSETSEPTPPPEPVPALPRKICFWRGPHNWHRIRVYLLSILLIVSMWVCGTLVTIRVHPKRIVDRALALIPFPSSTGHVFWQNRRTLEIDDVKIGGFFYADSIIVTASPWGLWRHHLAKVQINGGQVFTRPLYAALDQLPPGQGPSQGLDWTIGRLEISRGTVMLDNIVREASIPLRLGVQQPIVIRGLRLGAPDSSPEMEEERITEIVNVAIVSPVDPTSPVFFFPLTRVRYTYAEIWKHHIREIEMVRPSMYLGEDLFWLTKEIKSSTAAAAAAGPGTPWRVGTFEVQYGQLAVNAFGQPVVYLPFYFGTEVKDIRLDQLNQISAKATVPIYRLDQDYPDYKVRLVNLRGNLYFAWPPKDTTAANVVNTINIDEVAWNDIPVKDVETTVTFDPNGVYGKLYGICEKGQLSGNFEFYYAKDFSWNVNLFASKVDCQPIAEKLVGKYVNLTGELDGNINVQGRVTEILNCTGALDLPNPGKLEIKSMKELLDRIPSDWIAMKRDAARIAVTAFQSYPYDSGQLKIGYKPTGGQSTLLLQGPLGKRQFDIYLHPWSKSDSGKPHKVAATITSGGAGEATSKVSLDADASDAGAADRR